MTPSEITYATRTAVDDVASVTYAPYDADVVNTVDDITDATGITAAAVTDATICATYDAIRDATTENP